MQRLEESCVDVGRDHVTGRTDPVGHPTCDGTATGADFKAAPPLLDATTAEMSDRARVEDIGEGTKSFCRLLGGIIQHISTAHEFLLSSVGQMALLWFGQPSGSTDRRGIHEHGDRWN